MKKIFRSDLSVAKNLGSAGSGAKHWWHQRFTAVFLAIMTFWVICFSWQLSGKELSGLVEVVKHPYNIVMLSLFTLMGFYHSVLGMQVVIEDYVSCRIVKLVMLLLMQIFSIVTVVSFLVAVLYVMTL